MNSVRLVITWIHDNGGTNPPALEREGVYSLFQYWKGNTPQGRKQLTVWFMIREVFPKCLRKQSNVSTILHNLLISSCHS